MKYGEALEAVKKGKRAQRDGWNGKGMFIFMRPGDEVDIMLNIKSLPDSVKQYYAQKNEAYREQGKVPPFTKIKFTPYLCMKAADDSIVNGWLASQTDMLAEDWSVID